MLRLLGMWCLCLASSAGAQTLTVDGSNSPFTVATAATYSQITVAPSAVLIVDAPLTVTGDMLVQGTGRVTVSQTVMRLKLSVTGTLTVDLGGVIDADGKGLKGAPAAGYGSGGATLDTVSFAVIAGAYSGAGGSHASGGNYGHNGAGATPAYGGILLANPGGGGSIETGSTGGSGGGVVDLTVGTLILNGTIRANGDGLPGSNEAGGGAGGSVKLTVGTLGGAGTLAANGGTAYGPGFGGAGRIIVTLSTWAFNGHFQTLAAGAHAGTILVVDTSNRFYVVGPQVFVGGESYEGVLIKNDGALTLQGSATVRTPITVPLGSTVKVTGNAALNAMNIGVIDGRLEVTSNATQQGDCLLRGTLLLDGVLTVGNFDTEAGALVTHSPRVTTLRLAATGTMRIASGASVQASGLGAPAGGSLSTFGISGGTYEPVTGALVMGSGITNGGSHAGLGGRVASANALAPTYDDPLAPRYGGGGGGGVIYGSIYNGGAGGGVLRLTASALVVDGVVTVDGLTADPTNLNIPGGAGAGGSVVIATGPLSGTGGIYARGGSSQFGAGGGGGIIRLVADSVGSAVTLSVAGGAGVYPGGDGVLSQSMSSSVHIVSTAPSQVKAGALLRYSAAATGSGTISWSLLTAPSDAGVSNVGEVTWLAVSGPPQTFSLQATNGSATDVQTFMVTVVDAPSITSVASTSAKLGAPYLYDPDGRAEAQGSGPLTWSLLAGPAGFTVDSLTGEVQWTPNSSGSYAVCLRVTNSAGDATECFSVVVSTSGTGPMGNADGGPASNGSTGAPVFTSSPSTTAFCGAPYHYAGSLLPELTGSRPMTFATSAISGTVLPEGFSVDADTGELTWTPTNQQTGVHPIVLTATNSAGQATQVFSIVVECRTNAPAKVGCSCGSPGVSLAGLVAMAALAAFRRRRQ